MAHEHLSTYLNDHLAGAVAALELLDHLEQAHAGTPVARTVAELRKDIEADRATLEALMARLQVPESAPRKATAWLAERLARLKLRFDDPADGAFRLFESLEIVSLGIEGKLGLWRALAAAAPATPAVSGINLDSLMRRATDQRERVETMRIASARVALSMRPGTD